MATHIACIKHQFYCLWSYSGLQMNEINDALKAVRAGESRIPHEIRVFPCDSREKANELAKLLED